MAVQLNHHIVPASDPAASAQFLAEILGLDPPVPYGPQPTRARSRAAYRARDGASTP